MSAKLVPTFAGRGCHVVSVTDPYGRNLGFLDLDSILFRTSLYAKLFVSPARASPRKLQILEILHHDVRIQMAIIFMS
jgi:hypothetical protein